MPYDVGDTNYAALYGYRPHDRSKLQEGFPENWYRRNKDLVDRYHSDLLYFDGKLPYEKEYGLKLAAHFYNANQRWNGGRLEAVLNLKRGFKQGAVIYDIEKGQADRRREQPWQTDTTLNIGWFYQTRLYGDELPNGLRLDEAILIDNFVDIVSKNGNLLLNVGLRADGTLPDNQRHVLEELGRWLDLNGEAVFDTRPWVTYGEGPTQIKTGYNTEPRSPWRKEDIRFTTKPGVLYIIPLDWPGGPFTVKSLSTDQKALGKIKSVTSLGHEGKLKWKRTSAGLTITPPGKPPCQHACVFKLTIGASARER